MKWLKHFTPDRKVIVSISCIVAAVAFGSGMMRAIVRGTLHGMAAKAEINEMRIRLKDHYKEA